VALATLAIAVLIAALILGSVIAVVLAILLMIGIAIVIAKVALVRSKRTKADHKIAESAHLQFRAS